MRIRGSDQLKNVLNDILESLYKMRIRGSDQLKNVLDDILESL